MRICCAKRDRPTASSETPADRHIACPASVRNRPRVSMGVSRRFRRSQTLYGPDLASVHPYRLAGLQLFHQFHGAEGSHRNVILLGFQSPLESTQPRYNQASRLWTVIDMCHIGHKVAHFVTSGDEMSAQQQELNTVIPDLHDLSLERLSELGDSALAQSIALYRQRLTETGVPLNSFSARI